MVLLSDSTVGCNILADHLKQPVLSLSSPSCRSAIGELPMPGVRVMVEQCVGGVISSTALDFLRPAEGFYLTAYVAK